MNIATFTADKAKKRGKHPALFYKDISVNQWNSITWAELEAKVSTIARALVALDVEEQDNIGVISQNMPQGIITDFAAYANRAAVVPMFATLSPSQIAYILKDAQIKLLFVGEQPQYDAVLEALKEENCVKRIVVFDESIDLRDCSISCRFSDLFRIGEENADKEKIVAKRRKNASKDDLANIIYTSGTTGSPKGVMISHENIAEAIRMNTERLRLKQGATSIAFLPMSHIFERMWTYLCMSNNVKVYLNQHPNEIQTAIKEVHPCYMCAVPRFWEKVFIGVRQKIDEYSPLRKALITWAIAVGKIYNIDYKRIGKRPSIAVWMRYKVAHKLVFSKLKKILGIENGIFFPVAGAAMSNKQATFFLSIGIPILYGYGLTETTATVCCYPFDNYTIGSIGTVLPDVQVRIGDDNEIQIKGKTVTQGYYQRPQETAEAFVDGWFRTGDMGKLEGETLYMTDRLKDLFKTSNGKYISPQAIEIALTADPYIEQVAVFGNNRNYVTAIISPSMPLLEKFAKENNISYDRIEETFDNPLVQKLFEEKIAAMQADFASFEKVKKFRLIRRSFSIESGELTSTLKLKRAVIQQNYAALIEDMYAE